MAKHRDYSVDILKGLAMLMVVRIHTEVFSFINAPYPIIAVPLFFFLSGFYDDTQKPIKEWLPKTIKRLIVPGILWIVISFIYLSTLHYIKYKTIEIDFSIEQPIIANQVLWFLFALFYAKIYTFALNLLKSPLYVNIPITLILGYLASKINLPFLLDEGIAAFPFYYIGKITYHNYKKSYDRIKELKILSIGLIILGIACFTIMPLPWYPYVLVPINTENSFGIYLIYFLIAIISFSPLFYLTYKIGKITILANYGTKTLGILAIHPLLLHTFYIFVNRFLDIGSTSWIVCSFFIYIIVCILSYYCTIVIERYFPILVGK